MKSDPVTIDYSTEPSSLRLIAKCRGLSAIVFASIAGLPLASLVHDEIFANYGHIDGIAFWALLIIVVPILAIGGVAAVISHLRYKSGRVDVLILADIVLVLELLLSIYMLILPSAGHGGGGF